jgi:hypothetical protein
MMRASIRLCLLFTLVCLTLVTAAQTDLSKQANAFLSLLDDRQRNQAIFEYESEERVDWNFVPTSRRGIPFEQMNATQKDAAISLLKATLSDQGFRKANGVFSLEAILRDVEGRSANDSYRDPKKYYVTIFGKPSATSLWGWRIEGHHISVNVSSEGGRIVSSTPSFFGANPAVVPRGTEKGKQVLRDETDLGFALLNSLNKDQLAMARFSERALPEIVSGNRRKATQLEPRGILFKDLNPQQQKSFLKLLDVFVLNYEFDFSSRLMSKIRNAGMDNLSFAWAGSLQPGSGHYYRIQGPMLLIEYDNTQNAANHVHSVVRDLTNDFADDILREHYEKEHK